MRLGHKFAATIAAVMATGMSFDAGTPILGWTFGVVSVLLFVACMLHYLDRQSFDSDEDYRRYTSRR